MSGPADASLEGVAPSLSYYLGTYSAAAQLTGLSPLSGAPIAAGAYTVLASFAGSTDYAAVVALANYGIGQATPSVNVVDPGGTFSDAAFNASTTVSGVVPGVDDTPAATLEGIAPSLSYYLGTYSEPAQLAGLTALPAVPIGAGSYTVAADFGGSADYSAALAMANFTISPASPAVNVVAAGGTYNGAAFAASATVSGLNGVAGANLEGIAPSLSYYAGTYSNIGQLTGLPATGRGPGRGRGLHRIGEFPGQRRLFVRPSPGRLHRLPGHADGRRQRFGGDVQRHGLRRHGERGGRERPGRVNPGRDRAVAVLLPRDVQRPGPARGPAGAIGGPHHGRHVHGPGQLPRQRRLWSRRGRDRFPHRTGAADRRRGQRGRCLSRHGLRRHGERDGREWTVRIGPRGRLAVAELLRGHLQRDRTANRPDGDSPGHPSSRGTTPCWRRSPGAPTIPPPKHWQAST